MITDKKKLAQAKNDHDLHVLFIMKKYGVSKSNAQVQAYMAGPDQLTFPEEKNLLGSVKG